MASTHSEADPRVELTHAKDTLRSLYEWTAHAARQAANHNISSAPEQNSPGRLGRSG